MRPSLPSRWLYIFYRLKILAAGGRQCPLMQQCSGIGQTGEGQSGGRRPSASEKAGLGAKRKRGSKLGGNEDEAPDGSVVKKRKYAARGPENAKPSKVFKETYEVGANRQSI